MIADRKIFFLSYLPKNQNSQHPPTNSPQPLKHSISKRTENLLATAATAEPNDLFFNTIKAEIIHQTLIKLSHLQPLTPITTDSLRAAGISNNTVKQTRSKAVDIRFNGFEIQFTKFTSMYIGDLVLTTWQANSPNISPQYTTVSFKPHTYWPCRKFVIYKNLPTGTKSLKDINITTHTFWVQ